MNCCRICLTNDLTNEFPSIFAEVQIFNGIYRIFDAIREISPSILEESSIDCLPKKICWNCLKFCRNSFGFKKNCEETDKLFREILKEHNEFREELPANSALLHHDNYKITECPLLPKNLVIIEEEPSTVDLIKGEIDVVEVKTEVIEEKIDVLEVKPEVIEEKIDVIEGRVEGIDKKIKTELTVPPSKDRSKLYNCDKCQKTYKSLVDFNYHQNTHHKPSICIICGVQFKRYKYHNCKHNNLGSFHGKKFKDHINNHQNVKPFECEICKKMFETKVKLNGHKLCHTKKKVHECDVCGKVYVFRGALKSHLSFHISNKSYNCVICGKVFPRYKLLQTHKRSNHKRMLSCKYCKKRFKKLTSLLMHEKTHRDEIISLKLC